MFCDTLNRSSFGDVFSILYDEENASSRHAHIFFYNNQFFLHKFIAILVPTKDKKKNDFQLEMKFNHFAS